MSEQRKIQLKILVIILIGIILIASYINYKGPTGIEAINGYADLRNESIEDMEVMHLARAFVPLKGTENFHHKKYTINIVLPEDTPNIAFRVPNTECDYTLFVNGKSIYNHTYADALGFSSVIYYPVTNRELTILVSYDAYETKLYDNPMQRLDILMASVDKMYHYQTLSLILQISLVLICAVSAFLHFTVYLYNKTNKIHLYLFFFSLNIILELLFVNKILIHFILPVIYTNFAIYLLIFTYIIRFITMILISRSLLGQYMKNTVFPYIYGILAIISTVFCLINKSYIDILLIYDVIIFVVIFTTIAYSFYLYIKYYNYHDTNIDIIITNYMPLIVAYSTDILGLMALIEYHSRVQIGQIIFLLFQSSILSKEHFSSIENIKGLSEKLKSAVLNIQNNRSSYITTHIKPDYLYETLDTIYNNIDVDQDKVDMLIQSLAKYLRQSLDYSEEKRTHTLKNELAFCDAYIDLVKEQHPNITFNIPTDDIPNAIVPQYSIQALVENSIVHAFKGILHPEISIDISTNQNMVDITVSDNGNGMTNDEIISSMIIPKNSLALGLYHINLYLIDLYQTGLQVNSTINKYTKISFSVPISEKSEVNPFE